MSTIPDTLELTGDEIDAATSWHGGQSSMLYAVASTGALSRGTQRPYGEDGPMSDDAWLQELASALASEAEECAGFATRQINSPSENTPEEIEEFERDREALLSMAAKADALANL